MALLLALFAAIPLSLTLWDTRDNAQAMADRFGVGSVPGESASIARCEVREVAATA